MKAEKLNKIAVCGGEGCGQISSYCHKSKPAFLPISNGDSQMIGTMTDRQLRAHGVAAGTAGEIQKFEQGPFSVPSTGTPGTEYTVQSDGTGCNCPDHLYRRVVCKHITGAR